MPAAARMATRYATVTSPITPKRPAVETAIRVTPVSSAVAVVHRLDLEMPSYVVEPRATMITASRPGRGGIRASPERKGLVSTRPSRSRVRGAISAMSPKYTENASPFSIQARRPKACIPVIWIRVYTTIRIPR
jgi:hypothetical protein